jgi:hypothetical protein
MAGEKVNGTNVSEAQMETMAQSTGKLLAEQDKRKITIYLEPSEKQRLNRLVEAGDKNIQWPCETVSVNGYNYTIKRGVEVEVPLTVYEILQGAGLI